MPSAYNKRADDLVRTIKTILESNMDALGLRGVYYGDQDKIPHYPAVSVQSGGKDREQRSLHEWGLVLKATIFVHHGKVQSSEITLEEMDGLVEEIENVIHGNLTLNGTVIFGFVTSVEPGVFLRDEVMVRSTRMSYEAQSKEVF